MQHTSWTAVVAGLLAGQVAASGWLDAALFSSPGNVDGHCCESQRRGYDWNGLPPGSFSTYGTNSFAGFACSDSFAKRHLLARRDFQSKCITGDLDGHPSISAGGGGDFTIDQMQVTSSQDVNVVCEYGMPDGSTCHETHACSEGGSVFTNSQCGGAVSVTFKPGENAPPGCSIGVHSIGFHCGRPSSTAATNVPSCSTFVPPASSSSTSSSGHVSSTSSSVPAYGCVGSTCIKSATAITFSTAPSASSKTTLGCTGLGCATTPSMPSRSSTQLPQCYGGSCTSGSVHSASSSSPVLGSNVSFCSSQETVPPPVSSGLALSSSGAPPYSSTRLNSSTASTTTDCSKLCGSAQNTTPSSSAQSVVPSSSASSPAGPTSASTALSASPTPDCPSLLPRCLNTWLYTSVCKDNADANCFCGNQDFIIKAMECIGAWSTSDRETKAAVSYLIGLCASHLSTNPALITACPSTVEPGPSATCNNVSNAASATAAPAPERPAPYTTLTYSAGITIAATFTTGVSSGLTCSGSSRTTTLDTTITVPVVQITTDTVIVGGTTSRSVGLAAGSTASGEATMTSASSATSSVGIAPVSGASSRD